jgi:SAM-dependent methyltransferase
LLPGAAAAPATTAPPAPSPAPLRYAESCRFQARGIEPMDAKLTSAGLPDLCALVEQRLRTHGRCKLLETGCGEGRLLLELLARFGSDVELHGINHPDWPMIAGTEPLQQTNERYGVLAPERLRQLPLPTLHAADVQDLGSFAVREFDLIVSQAVLPHVPDKARALEDTAALLAPDGMFVHELDCADVPPLDFIDADLPRFTIYRTTQRISTREHLAAVGVELLSCQRPGSKHVGHLAVHRRAAQPVRLGLELDRRSTLQLNSLAACDGKLRLWGVRSVYRATH